MTQSLVARTDCRKILSSGENCSADKAFPAVWLDLIYPCALQTSQHGMHMNDFPASRTANVMVQREKGVSRYIIANDIVEWAHLNLAVRCPRWPLTFTKKKKRYLDSTHKRKGYSVVRHSSRHPHALSTFLC